MRSARSEIAGAGLDVWSKEPPPPDHPLLAVRQRAGEPAHRGGDGRESAIPTWRASRRRRCLDALDGKRPPRMVNPEVWPAYVEAVRTAPFGVHAAIGSGGQAEFGGEGIPSPPGQPREAIKPTAGSAVAAMRALLFSLISRLLSPDAPHLPGVRPVAPGARGIGAMAKVRQTAGRPHPARFGRGFAAQFVAIAAAGLHAAGA